MTVCVIHQPEYFPWLGFVDKVRRADVFVLLDHVQFDRSSMQNRTRIIGPNGPFWLTIPFVHRFPQRIDEVQVADRRWAKKHWKSIESAYRRAPNFGEIEAATKPLYDRNETNVAEVAIASIEALLRAFDARPKTVLRSSSLEMAESKGDLVLEICQAVGATTYLAGRTGATYLDHALFERAGIGIEVQRFTLPSYARPVPLEDEWKQGLSALDAWAWADAPASHLLSPSSSSPLEAAHP